MQIYVTAVYKLFGGFKFKICQYLKGVCLKCLTNQTKSGNHKHI